MKLYLIRFTFRGIQFVSEPMSEKIARELLPAFKREHPHAQPEIEEQEDSEFRGNE